MSSFKRMTATDIDNTSIRGNNKLPDLCERYQDHVNELNHLQCPSPTHICAPMSK